MERLIAVLGACNKYLCAFFLGAAVLIVFSNTVLRYFFSSGIIQAEELVRYFFVWATYLAIVSVYYEHRHIAVTTVVDMFSPKFLPFFLIATNLLALLGLGILIQGSIMYFGETTTVGQVTGIPYKAVVFVVIISATSCFGIVVADIAKQIRLVARGDR